VLLRSFLCQLFSGFFFDNPIIPLAGAVSVILAPKFLLKHMQKKRVELFERQLPDGLLMVSGSMRAGASLAVAMESMAKESKPPLSQEFSLMLAEQRLGVEFDTALSNMEKKNASTRFCATGGGNAHNAGSWREFC